MAPSASEVSFLDAITVRRSTVDLTKKSPISDDRIVHLVQHAIKHAPSAFNSQGTRVVILFGAEHDRLWDMGMASCEKTLPPVVFEMHKPRIEGFRNAYGTVLFYEDTEAANALPPFRHAIFAKFPEWAEHANAMNQFIVWTALCVEGLGCNLQHLQEHLNAGIAETWHISETWKLRAQLVFGEATGPPRGGIDKQFLPQDGNTLVFGR